MPHRARLLGFAFTNADFLFEVDKEGTILFAAGAANDLVRESGEALVGQPAGKLFKPSEGVKFATFAKALKAGDRAGPYKLTLAGGREANLSMFRLPENGANISCTLARPGDRTAIARQTDPRTGLPSRDGFLAATQSVSEKDALTLVDVPGLPDLCAQLSPGHADALMQRIGGAVQNSGARVTGQLSDTSFGAVAPATRGSLGLAETIAAVITAGGLKAPAIAETRIGLAGAGLTPEQRLLALRHVIERFAEKGRFDDRDGDIAGVFTGMMDETLMRLSEMTRTVEEGAFELAFQPICALSDGKLSHYEALARFNNKKGTADTVMFIEAMGIANVFDLAVANKALAMVEETGAQIAFNVSGATIASPASFGMLAAILARRRKLAPLTLIEITETTTITDLEGAGKAIAALRAMGYRVGLDDFGAGAASVNYLHAMPVDFVKFDGGLVKKIGGSARDDALLSGLAKLCREMGVHTIAECIESDALAKAALALGFEAGQGRHIGAPAKEIPQGQAPLRRRQGLQESWG
jgi:EAL domain-containing protein (putative c-di-GMP-specific phosphodiesterase class I)